MAKQYVVEETQWRRIYDGQVTFRHVLTEEEVEKLRAEFNEDSDEVIELEDGESIEWWDFTSAEKRKGHEETFDYDEYDLLDCKTVLLIEEV